MFDANDDARAAYRRVEILTGPGRRRRWSAEDKARVVAETLDPVANISAVARRWQICPQQLFAWRREARASPSATRTRTAFVPITMESGSATAAARRHAGAAVIEVELAGAVVRIAPEVDGGLLGDALRAVRSSTS